MKLVNALKKIQDTKLTICSPSCFMYAQTEQTILYWLTGQGGLSVEETLEATKKMLEAKDWKVEDK